MKGKKLKIITNLTLFIVVITITFVAFVPSRSITVSSGGVNGAIYHGNQNSNYVSIMINVYENSENVSKMLDILNKKGARATFFVGGCWADDNVEILNKIIEGNHELGNHGYFHKDHKKLSESENISEISNNHKIVKALTGYNMKLFAPPSGSYSKTTLKSARELNYQTIMWSRDTIDWRDSDLDLIISRATTKTVGGDLILMHPKDWSVEALEKIIDVLQGKNLELVTVSTCCGL